MTTHTRFICEEITQSVVEMSWSGAKSLGGFFQFGRYDREFSDVGLLRDCHIFSVYPAQHVSDWPQGKGPPDPSVFAAEIPHLMEALLGSDHDLYLHVKSVDREFFDEISVVQETMSRLSLSYLLLSPVSVKHSPDDLGNLIFECPSGMLASVTRNWFHSPVIEIEGYIINSAEFGRLTDYYFKEDSIETIRGVLSILKFGVRVWPDFNGIYLFSSGFNAASLRSLLCQGGIDVAP